MNDMLKVLGLQKSHFCGYWSFGYILPLPLVLDGMTTLLARVAFERFKDMRGLVSEFSSVKDTKAERSTIRIAIH